MFIALRFISLARLCAVVIAGVMIMPAIAAAQTNALKLVKGTITSSATGKAIDGGRLLVFSGSSPEPVTSSKINPGTGFYQVILSPATDYRFEVVSPRFYRTEFRVTTPGGSNYEESVKDLKVEMIPMGTSIYSGRLFEPGSSTLKEDPKLRDVVNILRKERAVVVTISVVPEMLASSAKKSPAPKKGKKGKGAAEPAPAPAPSMDMAQIAEARVAVVKNFLKQQGISTTRLKWDVKAGITVSKPAGKGKSQKYPDNVTIRITSIEDEEDNDS